ncbi:hypothetical protein AGMMS50268_38170 [Spirochaetia bacterium]|nr:hypothetical protein AGMMS50268_38170 [Spirochaetia bacterium]
MLGLKDENIVITDQNGRVLNDYSDRNDPDQRDLIELAIVDYNAALKINPNNTVALFNRADAYYDRGEYDLAIADYTAVLNINPNNASALNKKDDFQKAIADWTQAIKIDPNDVLNIASVVLFIGIRKIMIRLYQTSPKQFALEPVMQISSNIVGMRTLYRKIMIRQSQTTKRL